MVGLEVVGCTHLSAGLFRGVSSGGLVGRVVTGVVLQTLRQQQYRLALQQQYRHYCCCCTGSTLQQCSAAVVSV